MIRNPLKNRVDATLVVYSFYINLNEKILALPIDKLLILIETGAIEYNVETLKSLNKKSEILTLAYMINYKPKLPEMLNAGIMSTDLALDLLNNTLFNQVEYELVISKLTPSNVVMNESLANRICQIMAARYSVCDETIFLDAIRLCSKESDAVYTAVRRMQMTISDHDFIHKLLAILPEKYHELTELHKQPKYEETPYNTFLIKTLKEADFISSFSIEKGVIKVNSKRK